MRDDDTPVPNPISLELMAKLSTGSASSDEVSQIFLPHHIEICPSCRDVYERVQEIKGGLGYFDEVVALLESETAPELARVLESLPPPEQLRAAETDESFHTWGLCVYLLQESKEACLSDARRATELAILAVRIALALPKESYHPDWVQDLQARAFAYLANAFRVANELTAADLAFADADRRFSWSSPPVEAELLSLKSSLRREQQRYVEALEAGSAALKIYWDLADRRGVLACQIKLAKIHEATQDWASACDVLERAESEAGLSGDQRLMAALQSTLVILPVFESRGLTTEAIVAYTLLQLQRVVEARTFTTQLAAELAKRVRMEGRGR